MSSSSPISIGWPGTSPSASNSTTSSVSSTSSSMFGASWTMHASSSNSLTCAYPSWPSRNSLSPDLKAKDALSGCSTPSSNNNVPSSYISDFDLLCDLDEEYASLPVLQEAPATPRELPLPPVMAMPLQPLYAQERPRKQRRRSSKKTVKQITKPMTPIAECPMAAP